MAICGLMPDLPLTILVRVCRVTPRTFAPAVTDRPKGSRQSCRTMRPGCTGFFMGIVVFPLVVVDQFNVKGVGSFKTKHDAPVGAYRHRPQTFQIAFERVKAIPWNIQSL